MVSLDDLRKKHQELLNKNTQKTSGDSKFLDKFLKLNPGKNLVRILPGKKDKMEFFAESMIHRYIDETGSARNYHCRKVKNEQCPICDLYFDLWKMHKELNLPKGEKSKFGNLATQIRATPRYYMNVVDRKLQEAGEDPSKVVKIFSTGKRLMTKIMTDLVDEEYIDPGDPENSTLIELDKGNDYIVDLGKNGEFNSYDNSKARSKKTPAGSKSDIAIWMDVCEDLTNFIQIGDYEDGKKIADNIRSTLNTVGTVQSSTDEVVDDSDEKFNKKLEA